jgi:ADP-ribose pyrophosphatase YjhB (NUDIX family)
MTARARDEATWRKFKRTRVRDATLVFLVKSNPIDEILLGYKKAGFAQGKINGFGGKVEVGETIEHAAVREMREETSVQVAEQDLDRVAHLTFTFRDMPDWDQIVHVFLVRRWQGEPVESNEMKPAWRRVSEIPFSQMWQDDPHWLPRVLAGQRVRAWFTFGPDNETVAQSQVQEWRDWPDV